MCTICIICLAIRLKELTRLCTICANTATDVRRRVFVICNWKQNKKVKINVRQGLYNHL